MPGALLVWARTHELELDEPIFFATRNRQRPRKRPLRAIVRSQAWHVVKEASRRADVQVLAMRPSADGGRGQPAPIHPHLFRHARARHIVRTTKNLILAKRQLGWSKLQMGYLSIGDVEARELMSGMAD